MSTMPTWEEFMIPTLRVLADGSARHRRDIAPSVATLLGLPAELTSLRLSSGQLTYENRIGFGLSRLTKVGALKRVARGSYAITATGHELIEKFNDTITVADLNRLAQDPESLVKAYESSVRIPKEVISSDTRETAMAPVELVEAGIEQIEQEVANELLERLQDQEPAFFEEAVVKLLLAMGYGGTEGTGVVTPLSGDGGIDGVIDQDVLGLSRVYVQAKRYGPGNVVGRPDIQAFVGALSGKADRGVFITTSRFSADAHQYAENVPTRIILIDGDRLTRLMIRYNVGVQVKSTYDVVEIDEDFFA
ncbi:MAG: restriction endonuclease [Acidimicrobiia bacterium]